LRGARIWAAAVAVAVGVLVVSTGAAETVLATPISNDPFTTGGSQHATQVEPDSFAFGNTIVALTQSGRWYGGGGSNDLVWASSQNGGRTWATADMPGTTIYAHPPGTWPRISDPSVAYDPQDNVWLLLGLGINSSGSGHILLVDRSTDGGLTWSNPFVAGESSGSFWDKTWITCDTWASSPYYGNCYIEYDDYGQGTVMKMVTSSDGGLTWGPIRTPSGSPTGLGGQPVVQPNGTVVVPFSANGGAEVSFRSTNGGDSWSSATTIAGVQEHRVAGNMRTFSLPSAEVAGDGRVYVAWQDCRFRSGCPGNDIVYSSSLDGLTWSAVTRIPIDPTSSGADHFLPGIAVDKNTSGSTTHLAVGYYYFPVSNCTVADCQLTVGFVSSLDAGATWTTGRRIGGPMNISWIAYTDQGFMVGDYISTSFTGDGKAHPIFSLAKAPTGSIFSQRLSTASFDVTAPPLTPRAKSETGPVYLPRTKQKRPARLITAN
jgi:hypothetical protein